ncbi:hypothetical protein LVJ94_33335 [Pendulispora rubella]|uniref:Uncharacterized protein n=1 Tax=Pendulispora rubella TaxID=2741070 RepID=A0ABZ2KT09_9BACT
MRLRPLLALSVIGSFTLAAVSVTVLDKVHHDESDASVADLSDAAADAARSAPAMGHLEAEAGPPDPCALFHASNEALIASFEAGDAGDGCAFQRPRVGCVTTTNGVTWGYRIVRAQAYPGAAERCYTAYDFDLVRRDDAGTQVVPSGHMSLSFDPYSLDVNIGLDAAADYDNDGEVELLRTTWTEGSADEEIPMQERTLLTFKAGDLAPYEPASGITIEQLEDVDQDGRPDLISRGPYAHVVEDIDNFHHERAVAPSIFAYLARLDGTFVLGDAASIAFTRRYCDAQPAVTSLTVEDTTGRPDLDHSSLATAMTCTVLRGGKGAARIVQAWNAVCRNRKEDDDPSGRRDWECQDWPKELATIRPPFVLE